MKTGHAFDKLQKSTNQKTVKHNEQIDKQLKEITKAEPAKQSQAQTMTSGELFPDTSGTPIVLAPCAILELQFPYDKDPYDD